MNNIPRIPVNDLNQEDIKEFFLSHLNRIFCAKNQLADRLPELVNRSYYLDLQQAILETIDVVNNQIRRMRKVYIELDAFYTPESCVGLIGLLDEAFQSIGVQGEKPELRDLSVLFYMQNIESIEMASFKVLTLVAQKLNNPKIVQQLTECYDEAKDDHALFRQITDSYLG